MSEYTYKERRRGIDRILSRNRWKRVKGRDSSVRSVSSSSKGKSVLRSECVVIIFIATVEGSQERHVLREEPWCSDVVTERRFSRRLTALQK